MKQDFPLLPLFENFINDTAKGRRLKPNGQKIKPQSVNNYRYTCKLLQEFSTVKKIELRIKPVNKLTQRQLQAEKNYWKKFYRQFADWIYRDKNCYDNYAGSIFKIIRSFFAYLNKEKLIPTGPFYKQFHIKSQEINILTLLPEQLQFLINNKSFEQSLARPIRTTHHIFVFGCTVALRFSDLFNIRFRDVEMVNGHYYLSVRSVKTETPTRVKLPAYAVEIINKYRKGKTASAKIFPSISLNQFNKNLRVLAEAAGWTQETGKLRSRNGELKEVYKGQTKKAYRFCDLVSSHIMRRTAVTTMLILGMPENVVRKISGHAAGSKAFYRYVNFAQSYLDEEIDKVHEKLAKAG